MSTPIQILLRDIGSSRGNIVKTTSFGSLKSFEGGSLLQVGETRRSGGVFGWRDEKQNKFNPITAYFAAQATGFVKSIKLVGFLGTTQVSETQMWMRVFREIYHPSTVSLYQQKREYSGLSATSNPMLPYGGIPEFSGEGLGSLDTVSANIPGQWVVLWLLWGTNIVSTGMQTNGVMIDYYYSGTSSIASYIELDQDPKKSSGYSKSGTTSFKSNALASYSSDGISGYKLGSIAGDSAATKYYLRDDPTNSIPVLQSIKSVQVNVPAVITAQATYTETSITRFNDVVTSTLIPTGASEGNAVPGQANLYWSSLVLKKGSQNHLIAVDYETLKKLEAHQKNSNALVAPNFATTGGKQIVGSGPNQNYIAPNLIFSATPKAPQYWDVVEMSNNVYIQTEVVDGSLMADIVNATTQSRDTGWIEGYAPTDGTPNALYAAREKYWYVLPKQTRSNTTGACICQTTSVPNPNSDFTSPSAPCSAGFHWGKFLKATVSSSRGFDDSQLSGYMQSINYAAQNAVNNELVGTNIQGYIISSNANDSSSRSTQMSQISFSLRNVLGFEIGSNVGFPQSTNTAIGGNKTTSFGSTDQTGGSSKTETQYTGPPKDWKKAITEATDRLLAGQTVEQLTPARLAKFLAAQVDLGTPLPLLKETVLASILAAKLTALQAQGKTKKVAEAEIKNDPLYQALVLAIQTTKAKSKSQTGSSSGASGSGDSGGGTVSIRISVVRGLPGYRGNTKPTASIVGQPELVQTYEAYGEDGQIVGDTPPRRFVFPFVPREVTYSGIGTQWTEIPRSGNYPIVDWTGFNLLKISFNFDIVDNQYENVSGFGLHYSCEDEITKLRKMAQTPYPVTFLNMDKFMTDEVRWPLLTSGRGIEFVIADFSVTAIQRTGDQIKGIVPNQISRATCSMTLQEIPIENVDIVQMPPIRPCKKNCEGDIPTTEDKFKKYLLYTSGS